MVCVTACNAGNRNITHNGIYYAPAVFSHQGVEENVYFVTGCDADITVLDIPEEVNGLRVTRIENEAFKTNQNIVEIHIPNTIGFDAYSCPFKGCMNIEKIISPTCDMDSLFYGSRNVGDKTPSVPDSVKYLYLTNDCTDIQTNALNYCSNIRELHIPKSVTKITDGTNYTIIGVNGHTPTIGKFDSLPFIGCENLTIYCEAEEKPTGWGEYWNYIDSERSAPVHWGSY